MIPARWKHQNETKAFFDKSPIGFDFSSPGTGKTRAQIDIYNERKPRKRWLILCPKTLMESAWGNDIEKFAPNLTVSYATAENREGAFKIKTDVVVMNIDGVKWLADKKNIKWLADFDHLTIDESTAYKNPSSQRSKAVKVISRLLKYKYLLTGTPTPNTVMELWHPALLLDGGKRLGDSYFKLRAAVQVSTQIGPGAQHIRWDDKPGSAQAVHQLLSDITIRHAFEDVMIDVPPNHRDMKEFKLSPSAKKVYDTLEADCIVGFEDGGVISAVHAASLRTKLLQTASGAVYDGSAEGAYRVIDTKRYEFVADLVEDREHSVVFFNWKHQRDLLAKEFDKRDFSFAIIDGDVNKTGERERIVNDYQAGKYKTLLLHYKTGAHGLTLTRGTTTIVCSPIYEADYLQQLIHRIYRGGQTKVTNTILIHAAGTVETAVYARLDGKYDAMNDYLQLAKRKKKR